MNMAAPTFDVGIIGGGPAGASLAAYLARAGLKCVVLEREYFPRPHVGESLVPAANRVLAELGLLEKMETAGFPHKYGAAWTSTTNNKLLFAHDWAGFSSDQRQSENGQHTNGHGAATQVDVRFDERAMHGFDQPYTYHVDRGKFDQLLLDHAAALGAKVYQGCRVHRVDLESVPNDYPKIFVRHNQQEIAIKVRLVVDASGRHTLLGNQLKLKVNDPVFNQFALHTWFADYDRGNADKTVGENSGKESGKGDYIFVHFLPISNSWVWQIPITDTITSFGVVTQKQNFPKEEADRETFFWQCVETHPDIAAKLRQATQLRPLQAEGDYSYAMTQFCGDGYVLIGDAARFVDPIFSSGVSVALNSARLAAQDILEAIHQEQLVNGLFVRQNFEHYETLLRRGTKNWYAFITLYYRLNVLFTTFVRDPRYRLDIIKLLQGDVYDEEEPPVLQRMRDLVTTVENDPTHIWHQLLNDLTANAFRTV